MSQANTYYSYPDFVIRTPLFSLENINEVPSEPEDILNFIKDQWRSPVVKDAILLASPSLFDLVNNGIEVDKLSDRLVSSFLRYFLRMCFRSTPFGLFAGVGTGVVSSETILNIQGQEKAILKYRLDMEYLGGLILKWTTNPDIRNKLSFRANTSLYLLGSKWRYIEFFFAADKRKKYRIISLDRNPVLDKIIYESKNLRVYDEVIQQLVKMSYNIEDASSFINELIDSQILISDIFPNLSGQEFMGRLHTRISEFTGNNSEMRNFHALADKIDAITKPGELSANYKDIRLLADDTGSSYNPSHLIQADMQTPCENVRISKELSNRVLMGIRILKALSRRKQNKVLEVFKEHYIERFGSREVPLPLVMDSEYGVGLFGPQGQQMTDPSPLLDGLDFNMVKEKPVSEPPHQLLLKKLKSDYASESPYIELDKNDLRALDIRKGSWPKQVYAMFKLAGSPDKANIVYDLASAGNPSALMGRFGFMEPEGHLNSHIRELVRDDINCYPDNILADIVHLPEDRTGNILQRPSYLDWEICYMASEGQEAKGIKPDEILVSVVNDKVLLKHIFLNKQILPRLINSHNYRSRQLPLYQFLAECACQDDNSGYFPAWGWLSGMHDFLPGIKYGNLILCRPSWRLKVEDKLRISSQSRVELYDEILSWAEFNDLPESVIWAEGDHEMLIRWSNFNIVMAAWDSIRKRSYVLFKDNPFSNGSPVNGHGGSFANELLLSYKLEVE